MGKIKVTNNTCGPFAYGKNFRLVPGENNVDRETWERFKNLKHIAPRVAAGDLVEGAETVVDPAPVTPEETNTPEDQGEPEPEPEPKSKRRRKKKK